MTMWVKKNKGWSTIWTHPYLSRAIVDTNGFGINARISYDGHFFDTLAEAKDFAEQTIKK
jgi:hypothetical protein